MSCSQTWHTTILVVVYDVILTIDYGEAGATEREGGGHVKFYTYEKWSRKSFSHAKGGGAQKVLG